jgi:arylsulfatase A-like enzyme
MTRAACAFDPAPATAVHSPSVVIASAMATIERLERLVITFVTIGRHPLRLERGTGPPPKLFTGRLQSLHRGPGDSPAMAASARWIAMAALVAGIAAAAGLASSNARSASPAVRPNVVVLMTDDQTVESMRVMPNVRALVADQGVTFDNSFVSYSLCCPSRATFLTGQYAHNHGVWGNSAPNGGYYKLDSTNTLPVWLQRAGYQTIHLGKYLNGYGTRSQTEIPPGWGERYGTPDPSTYRYTNYSVNENGKLVSYTGVANYKTDYEARKAVSIIARQALDPRPFFLWVAFVAPHSGGPRDPDDPSGQSTPSPAPRHRNYFSSQALPIPPSFNESDVSDKPAGIRNRPLLTGAKINAIRENYQQRLESLLAVDEAVGQIVNQLNAIGELDKTYILFTSDNGFFHGEHRVPAGKVLLYEPSIRVPLVMRGPGIPAGQHRSQFVENIDLARTIVAATGAQPGRVLDGRSLLPFAKDPLLHSGRDLLLETPTYAAIRTPNWLYAEHVSGERELYNLARDRDELTSLHNDLRYSRVEADLARRLARLRGCAGASCRQGPQLGLRSRSQRGRGPRACRHSRVFVSVGGPSAGRISHTGFYLDGHLIKRDRRRPFTVVVPKRLVRPDGSQLEALVTLTDSRRHTLPRRIAGCLA